MKILDLAVKILASGLGTGYSPIASGTAGSALAAVIAWYAFPAGLAAQLISSVLICLVSVPVSGRAEQLYGSTDDSHIVIDEVAGYWISLVLLPHTIAVYAAAFLIFRVYDVIKPFFVRRVQEWPGGWGITADDFFAGILTNLTLQAGLAVFSRIL